MKDLHHGVRLLGTSTLGPKGQVVIPAEARELMGVEPGDKIISLYVCDKNTVCFVSENQIQELVDRLGENLTGLRQALEQDKK